MLHLRNVILDLSYFFVFFNLDVFFQNSTLFFEYVKRLVKKFLVQTKNVI